MLSRLSQHALALGLGTTLAFGAACSHNKKDADDTSLTANSDSQSASSRPERASASVREQPVRTPTIRGQVDDNTSDRTASVSNSDMADDDGDATSSPTALNTQGDNSRENSWSDGNVGVSADQQGDSETDVEITRKIRRSLTSNEKLSVYAHNVKIITRDGDVVLKGPVRSAAEKKVVEDTANTIAGADNVKSEIQVTPK